eukprot:403337988
MVEHWSGKTCSGLMQETEKACENLLESAKDNEILKNKTSLTIKAVCAIYRRLVKNVCQTNDDQDIDIIKEKIHERSQILCQHAVTSKNRIAQNAKALLRDGMTILIHGQSSVVMHTIIKASQRGIKLNVIVTESLNFSGQSIKKQLEESNIPTKVIQDAAVAVVMPQIDAIFVGCEAVVENGGVINKIGTFTIALVAKTFQKPFYVFTESLKFMKEFPLRQEDALELATSGQVDIEKLLVDYTPPEYISLLFTSIGIFTPSAVCDELIEFFSGQ